MKHLKNFILSTLILIAACNERKPPPVNECFPKVQEVGTTLAFQGENLCVFKGKSTTEKLSFIDGFSCVSLQDKTKLMEWIEKIVQELKECKANLKVN